MAHPVATKLGLLQPSQEAAMLTISAYNIDLLLSRILHS